MRFFTKNRRSKKRIIEEWVYERVADELDANDIRRGLWTKAMGLSNGDTNKCESIYIQLRAESIFDEAKVLEELQEIEEAHKIKNVNQVNKAAKAIPSSAVESKPSSRQIQTVLEEEFSALDFATISLDELKSTLGRFDPSLRRELINTEDIAGSYLIHYTVKSDRLDCTEFLISQGASKNVKNYWGSTPLEIAEQFEMTTHIELLKGVGTKSVQSLASDSFHLSTESEYLPDFQVLKSSFQSGGTELLEIRFNGKVYEVEYISQNKCYLAGKAIIGYDAKCLTEFEDMLAMYV